MPLPSEKESFSGPILPTSGRQMAQNQVKSTRTGLGPRTECPLFFPKADVNMSNLDSVSMSAFGHKRLAGLFLASLVTPFGAARLLRKLRVVSGDSVGPRLERRPYGRLFEFRKISTIALI